MLCWILILCNYLRNGVINFFCKTIVSPQKSTFEKKSYSFFISDNKFLLIRCCLGSVECTVWRNPKPQYLPFVPVEHYSILQELSPLHTVHRVGDSCHRHSCVASQAHIIGWQYFKPSSQLPFGRFIVCKPPQRIVICTEGKLSSVEIVLKILCEIYNCLQLLTRNAVSPSWLWQCFAGVCNNFLLSFIHLR